MILLKVRISAGRRSCTHGRFPLIPCNVPTTVLVTFKAKPQCMRYYILFVLLLFGLSATMCKKGSSDPSGVCGVKDPSNNLPWLKSKLDEYRSQQLTGMVRRFRYEGSDILSIHAHIQSCYPCELYTCTGRQLEYAKDSVIMKNIMANLDQLEVIAEF